MVAISTPQRVIERVPLGAEAITMVAIRKIIEGGIDGEPIPYAEAVNGAPSRTSLELSLKMSSLGRLRPSRMSNMSDWTITVSYILRPMHWLRVKWKNLQR
jgi:hypothetical protein